MNEAMYQDKLLTALHSRGWKTQVHDDKCCPFIPDLSFAAHGVDGWIEVKWLNKLPKTMGHIRHFTFGQEQWLKKVGMFGSGHCFLWIGSKDKHWIIKWQSLYSHFRVIPFADAMDLAFLTESSLEELCDKMTNSIKRY